MPNEKRYHIHAIIREIGQFAITKTWPAFLFTLLLIAGGCAGPVETQNVTPSPPIEVVAPPAAEVTISPILRPTATPTVTVAPSPTPLADGERCEEKYPSVGGVISGTLGTAWAPGDVYCVTEDLEVPVGHTLTINNGTSLVFPPGQKMTVAGQLIAEGNAVFPINFMSVVEAGWEGIHFLPSAQGSICTGCYLQNLSPGSTALQIETPLTFQYGLVRDVPKGTAISATVPITLANLIVDFVETGIYLGGASPEPSRRDEAAASRITHLTLALCQNGVVNAGQALYLDNSIMVHCDTAISTQGTGSTEVAYTLLYGNEQDYVTGPSARLILGEGLLNVEPGFVSFPDNLRLRPDSPAVNAADPRADYSAELGYNGGRADMGAYGNTMDAPERPPLDQMALTLETDAPLLIGRPGETVTYTLTLENKGTIPDTYSVSAELSNRGFFLKGLDYSRYGDDYYRLFDVGPQEQRLVEIGMKIPAYATSGMFNMASLHARGTYTGYAELLLTTIVSSPTSIEQVGHIGTSPIDVFVQGSYAYVAAGSDGLRIVDISDPTAPTEVGFYDTPDDALGIAQDVVVLGDYAYLAAGLAGLRIVDVSDPAALVEVGVYDTAGLARKVAAAENYVYVVWDNCQYCGSKLRIVDVSNPTHPVEVGVYSRRVEDMAIVGSCAYVAAGSAVLRVVDVSNPASPVEVSIYDKPGYTQHTQAIVVADGYAYIAKGDDGLLIMDISNPASPVEVGSYDAPNYYVRDVMLVGDYVHFATSRGLHILDISDPTAPVEVVTYDVPSYVEGVRLAGDYAYIITDSADLRIVDVSDPTTPTEVGTYGTPVSAQGIAVVGHYTYVADEYNGLRVVDASNPARPVEVGFYDERGGAWDAAVVDNYAYAIFGSCDWVPYVGCDRDLYMMDVSNPAAPVEVGFYDLPEGDGRWGQLEISGDYAYILNRGNLHVLDISDPSAPARVKFPYEHVEDIALANGYLYILPPNGFAYTEGGFTTDSRLDILDSVSLTRIGSYRLPEKHPAEEMIVAGNHAYIYWNVPCLSMGCVINGWLTVDVSDPTTPTVSDISYKPVRARGVAVADNYAYIADWWAGLHVVDISDPANPTEVDAFGAPGEAMDVTVANGYIYLANGSGGLFILRYPGVEQEPTPCALPPAEPFAAAPTDRLGCPTAEVTTTDAAVQPFERGLMLWRTDEQAIYVLSTDGTWARYADTWDETQPPDDPSLTPPERLLQPVRGFGKVWREQLGGPQGELGWALERERGYEMLAQPFTSGWMFVGAEGEVPVLYADGTWESD